nr:MAG TPA: hypothetical protein [Crassvirales sp.]
MARFTRLRVIESLVLSGNLNAVHVLKMSHFKPHSDTLTRNNTVVHLGI